jgi:hypothetical protein
VVGHGDHLDEDLAHLSTADELEDLGRVRTDVPVCDGRPATDRPGASTPQREGASQIWYDLRLAGNEPAYIYVSLSAP